MTDAVLISLAVGSLWAVVGVVVSRTAKRGEDFLIFMSFTSLLTASVAWIAIPRHYLLFAQRNAEWVQPSLLMLMAGLFSSLGMLAMQHGMRSGHHGATWTIGQSALVCPFVAGLLIWKDAVQLLNVVGVLAILCSIMLFGMSANRGGKVDGRVAVRWLSIALLALALLGTQQTLTTIPSRWAGWQDAARLRVPMLMTGSMMGYNTMRLGLRRALRLRNWGEGILLCVVALVSHFLSFRALDIFGSFSRAALFYPIAIGACTTIFAMRSVFLLKEKTATGHLLGMGVGCLGVILVAL